MKRLYLTAVIAIPSEDGQKRIDEALEKQNSTLIEEVFRDEHGHTREFYEDVTGKVPKGFSEAEKEFYNRIEVKEIDDEGFISLSVEEIEYVLVDCLIPLSELSDVIDNQDIGSTILKKDGTTIHVKETVKEIDNSIYLISRSKYQIFKDNIKNLLKLNK